MKQKRESGLLLHISSLPSDFGIGDLGNEALKLIDLLSQSGISNWQILPISPNGPGNSPYSAYSAFAGDPLYISPARLLDWGLISEKELDEKPTFNENKIDFEKVTNWKTTLHTTAWINFTTHINTQLQNEFNAFIDEHGWWLNDYALYMACKKKFGSLSWTEWDEGLVNRNPITLEKYRWELKPAYEFVRFQQFLFYRQWFQLKNYANHKGISIIGDLPLYVSHDSSDIWANQNIFILNSKGLPTVVGGVPPDYFCAEGQLWGNPVFNWDEIEKNNFSWWISRIYFNLHLFNKVRIDHFRGLESFWAVDANAPNAINGKWMPAKGKELLSILKSRINSLPIIAEDLGIITSEVEALRDQFNLPGMKVLQFAFLSDYTNEHLPHNYITRNIAYTGTHDNDTLIGWLNAASEEEKKVISNFITKGEDDTNKQLIRLIWGSNAEMAIIPMQDLLELGSDARMNTPGIAKGNWCWRMKKSQLDSKNFNWISKLNKIYNRC
jgi:4-alpha-glucanotransferase